MRIFKRLVALVYLLSAAASLGVLGMLLFRSGAFRFLPVAADHRFAATVALGVAMAITGLGAFIGACRLFFSRREPDCVRAEGNANIEVTLAALESCARAAAQEEDVLIERVEGRIKGSDRAAVRFKIDAIALEDDNLAAKAQAMQQRVTDACETMLGASGVTTRVRFLSAKTTTHTREVSGE